MKALSVKQPFAWLIVAGLKDIENRSWSTNYRGSVLIHATAKPDREMMEDLEPFCDDAGIPVPEIVNGAIIGQVDIVDCVNRSDSEWFEGPFGWVLENPVEFTEPIPAKGALGLWEWTL